MSAGKPESIGAAEFKAKCLRLIDEVAEGRKPLVITKRGKALVKLVPIEPESPGAAYGDWKGKVKVSGDIVYFDTSDEWEALK